MKGMGSRPRMELKIISRVAGGEIILVLADVSFRHKDVLMKRMVLGRFAGT